LKNLVTLQDHPTLPTPEGVLRQNLETSLPALTKAADALIAEYQSGHGHALYDAVESAVVAGA